MWADGSTHTQPTPHHRHPHSLAWHHWNAQLGRDATGGVLAHLSTITGIDLPINPTAAAGAASAAAAAAAAAPTEGVKEKAPTAPRTADAATDTSASPAPAGAEGEEDLDDQEIDDDALSVSTVASSKASPVPGGSARKGAKAQSGEGAKMTAAEEEAAFDAFVAGGKVCGCLCCDVCDKILSSSPAVSNMLLCNNPTKTGPRPGRRHRRVPHGVEPGQR